MMDRPSSSVLVLEASKSVKSSVSHVRLPGSVVCAVGDDGGFAAVLVDGFRRQPALVDCFLREEAAGLRISPAERG